MISKITIEQSFETVGSVHDKNTRASTFGAESLIVLLLLLSVDSEIIFIRMDVIWCMNRQERHWESGKYSF